jgi:hypothetical protein
MTTSMTHPELAAALRKLGDGLACIDTSAPGAATELARISARLTELACQDNDPEIVTTMRTVAALCAEAAAVITAGHPTSSGVRFGRIRPAVSYRA